MLNVLYPSEGVSWVLQSIEQHSTAQHSTAQHSTAQHIIDTNAVKQLSLAATDALLISVLKI
jgi:hypothetical protein